MDGRLTNAPYAATCDRASLSRTYGTNALPGTSVAGWAFWSAFVDRAIGRFDVLCWLFRLLVFGFGRFALRRLFVAAAPLTA